MKLSEFNRLDHQKVMAAGQKAAAEAKDAVALLYLDAIIDQKPLHEAKILKRAAQ